MTETLHVPEEMRASISSFVMSEGIPVAVVSDADATVSVVVAGDWTESDETTLCANGWISCAAARAMAVRLKITPREIGRLLDHLHIKVQQCELGLF